MSGAIKKYSEVKCLVKNEINSIKSRDGELPPTPYVVVEVANRLKKLQPWEGYDQKSPLAANLKGIIYEIIKGRMNITSRPPETESDIDMDVIYISPNPFEALQENIDSRDIGRSVNRLPSLTKKEKLKKKLKKAS